MLPFFYFLHCALCLGGWAVLQVPTYPGLVGDTLKMTCCVRGNPPLHEVILYKDGIEIMRQSGLNPDVFLLNLTLNDQGLYSCRASWDIERRTRSVISAKTQVQVSGECMYWVAFVEFGCDYVIYVK